MKTIKALVLALSFSALAACGSSGGDQLFYVSMGDSLSVGVQADPTTGESVETNEGYSDQLFAALQQEFPNLELVKFGCPGETTTSMIEGGVCLDRYETGNQLEDAVDFLVANKDQVLLATIDIGANDVLQGAPTCLPITDPAAQQACFTQLFQGIGSNLSLITSPLFAASDGTFPVIGMNYYNTFLNAWFLGPQGQAIVQATVGLQAVFNSDVLGRVYGLNGFPVADVAAAFNSTDFTPVPFPLPPPFDMVPLNVATACQLTYLCPPPNTIPPNIHPNVAGYNVIANVFLAVFNSL